MYFKTEYNTIISREYGRSSRGRQLLLALAGQLKGLIYIIILPVIGIFVIFILGISKLKPGGKEG